MENAYKTQEPIKEVDECKVKNDTAPSLYIDAVDSTETIETGADAVITGDNVKIVANEKKAQNDCDSDLRMINDDDIPILSQFLTVAVSEKENRKQSVLLKGNDIKILVLALMSDSIKVIQAALDVFEVLVSSRLNHAALRELSYFLPALEKIVKNKHKYSDELRRDVVNMLRALNSSKNPLKDQSSAMKNSENVMKGGTGGRSTLSRPKNRGRETVLQLPPGVLLKDHNRTLIEMTLIKIQGILSLTFNLSKNYCIIRGKLNVDSDVFGRAIANLGFEVSLVYKNEMQEECVVPIVPDERGEISKENLPEYLPEDDYENDSVNDNAVCKQDSQNDGNKESLASSVLNFMRNSLFW